jgi:hypothetical protein
LALLAGFAWVNILIRTEANYTKLADNIEIGVLCGNVNLNQGISFLDLNSYNS